MALKGDEDILIRDRESSNRMAETKPLTDDERKELEELRASKNAPDKTEVKEEVPLPETHWLNLADGRTVTAKGVMSHYEGVPVLHSTEIPADLLEGGNPNAEQAHRF